jgi:hypothetical protein
MALSFAGVGRRVVLHQDRQPDKSLKLCLKISATKIFTSRSPVWDWIGMHGRDDSDPSNPRIVQAFIRRTARGIRSAD